MRELIRFAGEAFAGRLPPNSASAGVDFGRRLAITGADTAERLRYDAATHDDKAMLPPPLRYEKALLRFHSPIAMMT